MALRFFLLPFSIVLLITTSSAFINDIKDVAESPFVKGVPDVDCGIERLVFEIETKRPFVGRLFIKGRSNEKGCAVDFSSGTNVAPSGNETSKAKLELDFNKCGMERIRSLSPKGVTYTNTVTVQFHRTFITQGDKSYRVRCFYAEQTKTVASDFDVSNMPTHQVENDMELPSCTYSIRSGTLNGPMVHSPTVGDLVYHRWECTKNMQMYGILVHSCIIENESAKRQTLMIDPLGCAAAPDVVPGLTYNDDLTLAYTSSKAFKYPDDPVVKFHCQITICLKMDNGCQGLTPPSCETSRKIKRSSPEGNENSTTTTTQAPQRVRRLIGEEGSNEDTLAATLLANLDVIARDIFVLDDDDNDDDSEPQSASDHGGQQQRLGREDVGRHQQQAEEEEIDPRTDRLIPDEANGLPGLMPQYKPGRRTSYTSFYDGLPSITPSPAPTSSSDHRRSTLRRGTETATVDADHAPFTSDVHSSRWELCANRIILVSILLGFVLFFAGSVSFVVYVMMERSRSMEGEIAEEPFAHGGGGSTPSLSTVITVPGDPFPSSTPTYMKGPFGEERR